MKDRTRSDARPMLRVGALIALGLVGGSLLLGSRRSLSKAEVRAALLALPKNAPVAAIGLSRLDFRADLGEGPADFELSYLHVQASGKPSEGAAPEFAKKLPVVIVPGTPDTLFGWTTVVLGGTSEAGVRFEGVSFERDVYVLEIIGHGVAEGRLKQATFDKCARFVNAAVRALGIEHGHLVGNSYGGEFAWRAALDQPEYYTSLTLIDSSGIARRDGDFLSEEVAMRENRLAKFGWALNSRKRIEAALAPHFDVLSEGRAEEVYLVCSNRENWHSMVELARDENGERATELVRLSTPTLLVWGSDDLAYDPDYYLKQFAEALPVATSVVMPDTGHYPHEQRTVEFIEAVERFWSALERQ